MPTLSAKLTSAYGRGWSERNLAYMVRFAEVFSDPEILQALCAKLSWSHFKAIIYLDDPLKRDFYAEMCRIEGWNTRTLDEDRGRIKQVLFGGFAKCLYPAQKFDSDSERRFAVILERDSDKWFRPVRGQFQIFYKYGAEQPEYVPDFVAETGSRIYMVETKARMDLDSGEVQAKAHAALEWCRHATDYAQGNGGKPWQYLLIPHDEVNESRRLADFERFKRQ